MKHLGSGHQYTPMWEHVTYMVAIDTGNEQGRDPDNDKVLCPRSQRNSEEPSGIRIWTNVYQKVGVLTTWPSRFTWQNINVKAYELQLWLETL